MGKMSTTRAEMRRQQYEIAEVDVTVGASFLTHFANKPIHLFKQHFTFYISMLQLSFHCFKASEIWTIALVKPSENTFCQS